MTLSCNFKHLPYNYCRIFLTITAVLPDQRNQAEIRNVVLNNNVLKIKVQENENSAAIGWRYSQNLATNMHHKESILPQEQ